jgi:nucleotide-binding universal stress UspA family protein
MNLRSLALTALAAATLTVSVASAQPAPGWTRVELTEYTSFYDYYVPAGHDAGAPTPVIVFLHRSGRSPIDYRTDLQGAADAVGAVLALPSSTFDLGWGYPSDADLLADMLENLGTVLTVDPSRVGIGGHGDGATYALERALDPAATFSAVFGAGANSSLLPAPQELEYLPPVRLFYGENDAAREATLAPLRAALEARGIEVEVEVAPGLGEQDLPVESILAGVEFLVAHRHGSFVSEYGCENTDEAICLSDGRFRVTVTWETAEGVPGTGKVADLRSDGSGLFWFFNSKNWEVLVKVLNACEINDRFWVFSAASTNLEYTLKVEDLLADTSVEYTNTQGQAAPAINDTDALSTCDAAAE